MPFDPALLTSYPTDAGVYLMKNAKKEVIYIGKAKCLQARLKQYFLPARDLRPMIPLLLAELTFIETIIVSSEKEALLLENTLIKQHQPKFNILLKDDKSYIRLSINPKENWPRLTLTRSKEKHGESLHFGPYTNALAAREVFELMSHLFPLRQCSNEEFARRTRPCLLYSMKRCIAPCVKLCSREEYKTYVEGAIEFLQGKNKVVIKKLEDEIEKASEALEFEKAGAFLRTLNQVKQITQEKTIFEKTAEKSLDVLGIYREADSIAISKLRFRQGSLLETDVFSFSHVVEETEEILSSFLLQHYLENPLFPEEILLPVSINHEKEILSLLQEAHSKAKLYKIFAPQKGKNKDLVLLADKNAKGAFLQKSSLQRSKDQLLSLLQQTLSLQKYPRRIECFDISHLAGSHIVAACTVFIDGEENKKKMRLYHVKGLEKGDDYGALRQVLARRIIRAKEDDDFPDLWLIDGGKGQLNAALGVLQEHEVIHVEIASIVKEEGRHDKGMTLEKVFVPSHKDPISFPPHSPLLFFLQKIRDTSHEKAISFYRKTHKKKIVQSALDSIPGIGPVKRKRLLRAFGSMQNILHSSEEELKQVPGITSRDIASIKKFGEKQM